MAKSLRCRLGFHRWHRIRNDLGEAQLKCTRCGKIDDAGAELLPGL